MAKFSREPRQDSLVLLLEGNDRTISMDSFFTSDKSAILVYICQLFNDKITELKKKLFVERIVELKVFVDNDEITSDTMGDLQYHLLIDGDNYADKYIDTFIPMQYRRKSKYVAVKFLFVPNKEQTVIPILINSRTSFKCAGVCEIVRDSQLNQDNIKPVESVFGRPDSTTTRFVFKDSDGTVYCPTNYSHRREYVILDHSFRDYKFKPDNMVIKRIRYHMPRPLEKLFVEVTYDYTKFGEHKFFNESFEEERSHDFDDSVVGIEHDVDTRRHRTTELDFDMPEKFFDGVSYESDIIKLKDGLSIEVKTFRCSNSDLFQQLPADNKLPSKYNPLLYCYIHGVYACRNVINEEKTTNVNLIRGSYMLEPSSPSFNRSNLEAPLSLIVFDKSLFGLFKNFLNFDYNEKSIYGIASHFYFRTDGFKKLTLEEDENTNVVRTVVSRYITDAEEVFLFRYKLGLILKDKFNIEDVDCRLSMILSDNEINVLKNLGVDKNEL